MPCCLANTNNNFLCFSVIFFAPSNFFLISSFFNLHWERQIIFSFTLFLYLFFFLFVCDKQLFFFRSHLVKYPPYNLDKCSENNLHHKLHSLSFYSYLYTPFPLLSGSQGLIFISFAIIAIPSPVTFP